MAFTVFVLFPAIHTNVFYRHCLFCTSLTAGLGALIPIVGLAFPFIAAFFCVTIRQEDHTCKRDTGIYIHQ
jgi:hypothetical protein